MTIVLTNQGFSEASAVVYPYQERALQFGDGIYEVIRMYQGQAYLMEAHLDRLYRSAQAIKLSIPFEKDDLHNQLIELVERNKLTKDGLIYLQISRGSAKRLHLFPDCAPNFYAYTDTLARPISQLESGVSVVTHDDIRWHYCYIKSLNLLPNVLAKQTAHEHGSFDAILHRDDIVTESTAANVFIVKDNVIITHPATERILHGCVRNRLIDLARANDISVIEAYYTVADLLNADEVFMTSSGIEVLPVVKVDDQTIANGKRGVITKQLQQWYQEDANLI
ncbi:D-amino-acid transaminase [Amphibacillus cookii]|uniref:D-amino-acid transaminase n=1 Tax=Amphibacillus cookii TaxID=767787 RepID=UPI001956C073|nr:D-amino-acid transaminase [Amphibacillus cookii]MBM7540881.1 D-alanine transaminase [Amphibacillus cookii]